MKYFYALSASTAGTGYKHFLVQKCSHIVSYKTRHRCQQTALIINFLYSQEQEGRNNFCLCRCFQYYKPTASSPQPKAYSQYSNQEKFTPPLLILYIIIVTNAQANVFVPDYLIYRFSEGEPKLEVTTKRH
jgi:hypothetical protein